MSDVSGRLPWFRFYPADWRSSVTVRSCGLAARGLWLECLGIMHDASPRGALVVAGDALTVEGLALHVGRPIKEVRAALGELTRAGVIRANAAGAIYSRRMVHETSNQTARMDNGKRGGNPKLGVTYNAPGYVYAAVRLSDGRTKIGITKNVGKRIAGLRAQQSGTVVHFLDAAPVADMGAEEARLHAMFRAVGSGEWFQLDPDQSASLLAEMNRLKGNPENPLKSAGACSEPLSTEVLDLLLDPGSGGEPEGNPTAIATVPDDGAALFARFWSAYPRHSGKKAAALAFAKLAADAVFVDTLIAAIEAQRGGRQWREGFIPHAATWLNGERWTDEIEAPSTRQPMRQVGTWRERCPHTPTCETPDLCWLKSEREK